MTETIEGFRLSPQQRRLWSLQQRDGAAIYRARCSIAIEGEENAVRLRRALEAIIERHEILRTTFQRLPGMSAPLQVVHERLPMAFEEREGSPGETSSPRGETDLASGPVVRASLSRSGVGRALLRLDLPALCADRPTLERIVLELGALLGDSDGGRESLAEPLQYADIAEWASELFDKPESTPGIEYWKRMDLASFGRAELPFENPAKTHQSLDPKIIRVAFPASSARRLQTLSRELGSTPGAWLLTCWRILLQRLTGEPRVTLGYATEGRRLEELKSAVGPCARYLPIAVDLEDDPPFRTALSRVERALAEQEKWQDLFDWEALPGIGQESAPPFFRFGFEFAAALSARAGKLSLRLEEARARIDRFALLLCATSGPESLGLELEYDASVHQAQEVERFGARLVRLLESTFSSPHASVNDLELLPEEEKRRLWFEFNDTDREFPQRRSVLERFEEGAERFPDSAAVIGEGRRLSYFELNTKANRIAHVLTRAGVRPDSLVALCVERSIEMVVGLLAIWKAGGAYVPLDPSLPPERLGFLLEDTGASHLLTRSSLADRFRPGEREIVLLDAEHEGADTNPEPVGRPENLAYVIFTSGSTGRPKGVAVEHRQISNYVSGILERLDSPRGASFATVTTLSADLGNTAIFPSLATGGCLYVVSEQRASDPDGLAEDFAKSPVDYLKIVPSHLAALLSASRPERILPRRALILGGEASSWNLIDRVRSLAPACQVLNHYGPTEATIGVTTWKIPAILPEPRPRTVPIGRPLPNCRVFLLDSRGRTAPLGVAGELHIAGAGVARGYLNRPELTAERFVEVDLAGRRERLYRTGDLARHLPDGNLELLGRTDDQIKLHGFRIEPGEVEAALGLHPAVAEAAVLPRELAGIGRRLVAYPVLRAGVSTTSAELRRFLLERLPEFMVPSAFVWLARLPRTPNGKVDRVQLPVPNPARPEDGEPPLAPATREEKILAEVWREVLRLDRFGIQDNFFDLGGDSILAIQIIARAAREGLRLTPRQLFERQTIAELAQVAETSPGAVAQQEAVTGPVPLTPIQLWFFEQELLDPHHYNQSVLLEAREALDSTALKEAIERLTDHHDALRLRFVREDGGWRQSNAGSENGTVFSVVSLAGLDESEEEGRIGEAAARAQASLNLADGPIVRAVLFDFGQEKPARLLLVAHHLAVDAVSWQIVIEDLESAYRQIRGGEHATLPPKTTSFRDWAQRLSELAESGALERDVAYWRTRTGEYPAALPLDSEGENTVESSHAVLAAFSEGETRALLQEVPLVYRTQINDALLAVLAETLGRWTDSRSVVVDLEGHGREDIVEGVDLSRTVGWFTARFPVRLDLPESGGPGERLVAVKEQLRAIPRRGIAYGVLRYLGSGHLADPRVRAPEPQVSFNYLGQLDRLLPKETLFRLLPSLGPTRSRRDRRRHVLAVEGKVLSGRLRFAWIYSENLHRRATIQRLAEDFAQALRALIAHCRSVEVETYTPSDFPKARLSQKDLDRLVAGIKTADPGIRR